MKSGILMMITALLSFVISSSGQAKDLYEVDSSHNHSGFYFSMGVGFDSTTMEATYDGTTYTTQIDDDTGVQTAFKLGWSVNRNVQIYYGRFAGFNDDTEGYSYYSGLSGVGVNLFAKESDFFIEGLIGLSDLVYTDSDVDVTFNPKIGFSIGLGYQVATFMEIAGRYMSYGVTYDGSDYSDYDFSVSQVGITVSFCLY